MNGLLIGMRAYVNCACRMLRLIREKIRKYFWFYFYLSSVSESYFYFLLK